ncbi:hypothetical protein PM10SUCC1_23250 [Propionigenium maris DSM 9537]|uniref:DNA-binding transcriptional regulator, MarR family n=1 Tax=Propionigenium maris DSM 9537 TaxID=1123000 RepID=A0A9W6GN91_9FUSO|nr:hypothetical protein [Propionigenium maris]GLI56811.1 hypothetical protein PM10SUCC1_23250 [Propionigenium maris DSM 9537]
MDTLLVMNRIMGRYKSILKNEEVNLTFNETLAIEAIKRKRCTKNNVKDVLLKDKSYISRLIDSLLSRGILEKSGNEYLLTGEGEEIYRRTNEIYTFIREEYKKEITDEELDVIIKSLNSIEEALKSY